MTFAVKAMFCEKTFELYTSTSNQHPIFLARMNFRAFLVAVTRSLPAEDYGKVSCSLPCGVLQALTTPAVIPSRLRCPFVCCVLRNVNRYFDTGMTSSLGLEPKGKEKKIGRPRNTWRCDLEAEGLVTSVDNLRGWPKIGMPGELL